MFLQDMMSYAVRDVVELGAYVQGTVEGYAKSYSDYSGRFSRLEKLKMPVVEKTMIVAALFSLSAWLLVGNISAAITFGVTAIYVGTATLKRLDDHEHKSHVITRYDQANRQDVEPPVNEVPFEVKGYNMENESKEEEKTKVAAFDVNKFVEKAKAHLLCVMAC